MRTPRKCYLVEIFMSTDDDRAKLQAIARNILLGKVEPLDGCVAMVGLIGRLAGPAADHEAFVVIRAIESDADRFAVGPERSRWNATALAELDREQARFLEAALPDLHAACEEIAQGIPWGTATT